MKLSAKLVSGLISLGQSEEAQEGPEGTPQIR